MNPFGDPRRILPETHKRDFATGVDLEQSEVRLGGDADNFGAVGLVIVGRDLDRLATLNDVVCRDRIAIRRNEKPRSLCGDRPSMLRRMRAVMRVAELMREAIGRGALRERKPLAGGALLDFGANSDHRRFDLVDNVGNAVGRDKGATV